MRLLFVFVFLLLGLTSLVNAQTEPVKQPNCEDVEGLQIAYCNFHKSSNYTGIEKVCKGRSVEQFWTYKNGKLNGLCRSWYKNGQLSKEMNYKDDMVDGLNKWWHENGLLQRMENYKNCRLVSVKCWDEHGNQIKCLCLDEFGEEIECP